MNKDPLFGNKIAGALLTAALMFFGIPQIVGIFMGGGHGGHKELKLAYPIEFQTVAADTGAEAAAPVDLPTLLAAATPAGGERRAALCKSCHSFEKGGANGAGPNLWNVIGRPVAGHPGFAYSGALKAAGGNWTFDRLDAYIKNSQEYVPGTAMVQRLARADHRAEILVYLASLSDNPQPRPTPAEQAATDETPVEPEVVESAEEPAAPADGR